MAKEIQISTDELLAQYNTYIGQLVGANLNLQVQVNHLVRKIAELESMVGIDENVPEKPKD